MTNLTRSADRFLSISIPVFNFARFLPETLESLLEAAAANDVEVLVFDGCSTDDTQRIVRNFQVDNPHLRYVRALEKGGIDVDMARCVELASNRYCWLFSGDDVMLSHAIETVKRALEKWEPDVLLCRHNECDLDMTVLKEWPVLVETSDHICDLSVPDERKQYLEGALTSEAFFSFMGGLIVKRATWLRGRLDPRFVGSNWAHVARLFLLSNSGPFMVGYLHQVLLNRRGGNDSFSKGGMLSRLEIQISGLLGIMEALYGVGSLELYHIKRVVRSEVEPDWYNAVLNDLEITSAAAEDFKKLDSMIKQLRS